MDWTIANNWLSKRAAAARVMAEFLEAAAIEVQPDS